MVFFAFKLYELGLCTHIGSDFKKILQTVCYMQTILSNALQCWKRHSCLKYNIQLILLLESQYTKIFLEFPFTKDRQSYWFLLPDCSSLAPPPSAMGVAKQYRKVQPFCILWKLGFSVCYHFNNHNIPRINPSLLFFWSEE